MQSFKDVKKPAQSNDIIEYVEKGDMESFIERLGAMFSEIPAGNRVKTTYERGWKEKASHIFALFGKNEKCEVHPSHDRVDFIVESKEKIYIFELKLDSSEKEESRKIENMTYMDPYKWDPRQLVKVEINFSSKQRNITDWNISSVEPAKEKGGIAFETEIFSQFNDRWALLSAGTKEHHNSMTISWGGMGTLWFKPVVTIYVRPSRYTFDFLMQNDYFTVSFYPERYRDALTLMGSRSGREVDKDAAAGLNVRELKESVTYQEAEITIVCRKLYWQDLDLSQIPKEIAVKNYAADPVHRMFIGEVVEIIR